MVQSIVSVAREALEGLPAAESVDLVTLFGSAARGKARPDSDVDVGVLGGGFWEQLAVADAIGRAVGREPHVVDLGTASEVLLFEVARDGVLVREARTGLWHALQAQAMIRYWELAPVIELTAAGARRRLRQEAEERQRGSGG